MKAADDLIGYENMLRMQATEKTESGIWTSIGKMGAGHMNFMGL